jgi:hypothetical protein
MKTQQSFLEEAQRIAESRKDKIEDARRLYAAGLAPISGADGAPVHPLAPPSLSGNNITVDLMLNNPTRITRMIMDLTLQRFIADRIFASGGGVSGGAVIYDEVTANELYTARDVQRVEPGAEFPVITSERLQPKVAPVEKWGGKVWVPDEARDRNQTATFTNKIRQLANTQVRKINQRAIETLEESISDSGQTMSGVDWSAVVTGGSSQSNASLWPARDFAMVNALAEQDELGVSYTLWLVNPMDMLQLQIVYGEGLGSLLQRLGQSIYASNRVPPGKAYVVAEGQVGEMRVEKPLGTETWREPGRERTWVQSSVRPLMFVQNPYAVLEVTGIGGS